MAFFKLVMIGNVAIIAVDQPRARGQAESLRKQAHHAVSLFYKMGHLSGRKTRNGTSSVHMDALSQKFLLLILKKWGLIKQLWS